MAKHDIHGRKLFIQLISHPDQSDTENKIVSDRIISYDDEKTLTDFDLVYRKWVVDYLASISSGFQVISAGGELPLDPGVGDVHIMDDGTIMQWDGANWINSGSIPVSDTPTLQTVTDEGNTTDNAIQVSGTDNADTGVDSAVVRYTGTDAIFSALIGGSEKAAVSLGSDSAVVSAGASQVRLALSGTLGARFLGGSSALITVKGADAVDDNDFVTKRQLDSVAPTRTPDPSLSFSTTSSDLDTEYPSANPGDIVYRVDGTDIYVATKIASGVWQIQQSGT